MTRGELRAELHDSEQRMIYALGQMVLTLNDSLSKQMTTQISQLRVDLNHDIGTQIRASTDFLRDEFRTELRTEIRGSEERLRVEIRALDDQYRDLPARVATLEDHAGIKR